MEPDKRYKSRYGNKRWHLLFVRDDGRTVPIRHFKGVVWATVAILVVLLSVIGILLLRSHKLQKEKAALERSVASSVRETDAARQKSDRLLAQLAIAESNLKINTAESGPAEPRQGQTEHEEAAAGKSDPQGLTVAGFPQEKDLTEDEEEASVADPRTEPAIISADSLLVCQNPEDGMLQVEFKVINIGGKNQSISGHAFIVLKDAGETTERWLVFPHAPLVNGVPSQGRGMRFRIYNYRTMKFSVKHDDPDRYTDATIFVFQQDTGELLLERDFEITAIPTCP